MNDTREYGIRWRAEMVGREHEPELVHDVERWRDLELCDEPNPRCD